MDLKSKILFWFLVLLTMLSILAAFYNTVVLHNFDYYESDPEESYSENESTQLDAQSYE